MTALPIGQNIRLLESLLAGTGIGLLELTTPQETVRLGRDAGAGPRQPPRTDHGPPPVMVRAPCVGVFRHAHPLRGERLAVAGRTVQAGEAIGLLQVGALLVHVTSSREAVILDVVAAEGEVVGYGASLIRLADIQLAGIRLAGEARE